MFENMAQTLFFMVFCLTAVSVNRLRAPPHCRSFVQYVRWYVVSVDMGRFGRIDRYVQSGPVVYTTALRRFLAVCSNGGRCSLLPHAPPHFTLRIFAATRLYTTVAFTTRVEPT